MGESKKPQPAAGGSLLARTAVIMVALALVVIGANPFYRKYGGVLNYLDHISKVFADSWSRGGRHSKAEPIRSEPAADQTTGPGSLFSDLLGPAAPDGASGQSSKGSPAPPAPAKQKPLDKVSDSDRDKLDKLVSGL